MKRRMHFDDHAISKPDLLQNANANAFSDKKVYSDYR